MSCRPEAPPPIRGELDDIAAEMGIDATGIAARQAFLEPT